MQYRKLQFPHHIFFFFFFFFSLTASSLCQNNVPINECHLVRRKSRLMTRLKCKRFRSFLNLKETIEFYSSVDNPVKITRNSRAGNAAARYAYVYFDVKPNADIKFRAI